MSMSPTLFAFPKATRTRQWRMRVIDVGQSGGTKVIQFRCPRCGHNTGWIVDEWTISENKRGLACPNCNGVRALAEGERP